MDDANDTRSRHTDAGITIVEVLLSVVLMGIVSAVLAATLVVTVKQQANTLGRLNVARGEQNIGIWLPADLASAQDISTAPDATPCGAVCPAGTTINGSNALMVTWTIVEAGAIAGVSVEMNVSYRYIRDGEGFALERVECRSVEGAAPTCRQNVIAHDIDEPPVGTEFVAGVTAPTWAIQVTAPVDPADTGDGTVLLDPTDPNVPTKNAQRVLVTINGGGNSDGSGGGRNQIVLGAGGTQQHIIDGDSVLGTPTFTQARSRCGGNIAIIIDESGSIGTSITEVRTALTSFVNVFAGTPVKLEVVRFATKSSVLGTTGWSKWFNMLDTSDVSSLTTAIASLDSTGGTNWEDAFQRLFYNSDGTVQTIVPDLVVFFTDGVPTYSRLNHTSAPSAPLTPPALLTGYPAATGSTYNQEAWYRANHIVQTFRGSVRFIGVGVGSGITGSSTWLEGSPSIIHWERGNNVVWERNNNIAFQQGNNVKWQRGNNMVYERGYHLVGSTKVYTAPFSSWISSTSSSYNSNNTVAGESDGWRTRLTTASTSWTNVSMSTYELSNTTTTSNDGWRTLQTSASTTWSTVTQSVFERYNTTSDSTDGWRINLSSLSNNWTGITQADYERYNTTSDSNDGWRTRHTGTSTSWTAVTEADYDRYNSTGDSTDGWRTYEDSYLISSTVANSTILRRLIAGNDNGVPAISQSGVYVNADQADNYILPNWSQLTEALKAVALAECGGTLTLQTKVGTSAAADPFTYQNTRTLASNGTPMDTGLQVVTTTSAFPSGTFDFAIPSGSYVTVDIQPSNTSGLLAYNPGTWTCRAGPNTRSFSSLSVEGTSWTGIRLQVAANEAVSCVQTVTRK